MHKERNIMIEKSLKYKPNFEFEVRKLLDTTENIYRVAGIYENPFYYFTKGNNIKDNLRYEALRFISKNSKLRPYLYISGDIIGGSGKSYLLEKIFNEISEEKNSAVILIKDIVRYRYPICAIDELLNELEVFFNGAESLQTYCILDEVEFNEIYSKCCKKSNYIVAGGHYLYRDAGKTTREFIEVNIDKEWPLNYDIMYEHLTKLIHKARSESILHENLVTSIIKHSPTLGIAELICGLLLATKARRIEVNNENEVGINDVEFWLEVIPTNWFWFSMDSWRVRNPVEIDILQSCNGTKREYKLQIFITTKEIRRIEKD